MIFILKYFLNRVIITLFAREIEIIHKTSITMSELIKNLGVIILLIGVAILAVPAFTGSSSNTTLLAGLVVSVIGYISHIAINKRVE